ncbi:uncharacterized protein [Henckelia pumila]|uniref:uncharacterized protein n=1 Tax=Henckelia pumila TaxID=405737 RepID=UPI003C6E703B
MEISVDWSVNLLHEYHLAHNALRVNSEKIQQLSPNTWTTPPANILRMNVDAAYNERTNCFAIAGVIRNHEGQPELAFGHQISKPQSVLCSELLAIEGGLQIAETHNFQISHVTLDSLHALQAYTRMKEHFSYAGFIAIDIKRLLDSQSNTYLSHVRRSANAVAHSIAAFSISSSSNCVENWRLSFVVNTSCN